MKEQDRLDVFSRVKRKELTVIEAAEELGLSVRQARRMWKRFRSCGVAGLVHQLRGRVSNRRMPEVMREKIVRLYQKHYHDFGPTFACEKLREHGLMVSPDSLVSILKEQGLYQPMRKRKQHRKRRERRSCFGSLIQMDGSHHDWFEGRSPGCCLMVMIDDATNQTFARFYHSEDLVAAFDVFGRWCEKHGLPRALYVDKHTIYRDSEDPSRLTQFGRAMKELGVKLICAHSPQAKGRVERRNRVFQDRLVKELRLRKIRRMDQANVFLEEVFLPSLNAKYTVKAKRESDLHRQLPAGKKLSEILCVSERRKVGNDWCVRWRNRWLQIEKQNSALGLAGKEVEVRELRDRTLLLRYQQHPLMWKELKAKPKAKKPIVNNRQWRPSPTHPWNTGQGSGQAA